MMEETKGSGNPAAAAKTRLSSDILKKWFCEAQKSKEWLKEQLHVIKIYTMSPFLYGRVFQSDRWMRHAINVKLLEEDACEGAVRTLSQHELDMADIVEKAFNAVSSHMGKSCEVKEWEQLLSRCAEKSTEKVVCLGKGHHLSDKCRVDIDGSEEQVVIAILFSARQYVDHIQSFVSGTNLLEEFSNLKSNEVSIKTRETGNLDFTEGNFQKAASSYTQGISYSPFDSKLYSNRAQAYLRSEKYTGALSDGRRCILLDPNFSKGYHRYATALFELGKKDQAIHALESGIKNCGDSNSSELERLLEKYQKQALGNKGLKSINGFSAAVARDLSDNDDDDCPALTDGSDVSDTDSNCPQIHKSTQVQNHRQPKKLTKSTSTASSEKSGKLHQSNDIRTPNTKTKKTRKEDQPIPKPLKDSRGTLAEIQKDKERQGVIDELHINLKEGSRALLQHNYRQATVQYTPALDLINKHTSSYLKLSELTVVVVKYSLGKAHCETGLIPSVRLGVEMLEAIPRQHKSVQFPLVFLVVGQAFFKQNRFKIALEKFEKGLAECSKPMAYSKLTWPCTEVVIEESLPGALERILREEVIKCRFPPRPDAVCRYNGCSGQSGAKDACHFHVNIYVTDPDFKGYIELTCYDHCLLAYHLDCWKHVRPDSIHSDKDVLQTQCLTPNCFSFIKQIDIYDQSGQISKSWKGPSKPVNQNKAADIFPRKQKLLPSSMKTIKKRQDKKKLRKQRKEEVRQSKLAASSSEVTEAEGVSHTDAACSKAVAQQNEVGSRQRSEPVQVLKKMEAGKDDAKSKAKGSKVKKGGRKKDKVLTLDQFVGVSEGGSPVPLSPPPVSSAMGMDDFSDFLLQKSGFQRPPEPYPITPELSRMDMFEQPRRVTQTYVKPTPPPSNPWKLPPTKLEAGQHESIKETVLGLFGEVLQNHGPVAVDNQLVQDELSAFPPQAQALVQSYGGIMSFLSQCEDFVQVGKYVCLKKDEDRASLMVDNDNYGPSTSGLAFASPLDFPPPSFESKNPFVLPTRTLSKESICSVGSTGSSDRNKASAQCVNQVVSGQRSMSVSSIASDVSGRSSVSDKGSSNRNSGLEGLFSSGGYGSKPQSRDASPALSSSSNKASTHSESTSASTKPSAPTISNDLSAISEAFKKLSGLKSRNSSPSPAISSNSMMSLGGNGKTGKGDGTGDSLDNFLGVSSQKSSDKVSLTSFGDASYSLPQSPHLSLDSSSRSSPLSLHASSFNASGQNDSVSVKETGKTSWSNANRDVPQIMPNMDNNSLAWHRNMEWSSLMKASQDSAQEVNLSDLTNGVRGFDERGVGEQASMIDEVSDDDDFREPVSQKDDFIFPSGLDPLVGDVVNETVTSTQTAFSKAPGAQRTQSTKTEKTASPNLMFPPGLSTGMFSNQALNQSSPPPSAVSPMNSLSLGTGLLGSASIWGTSDQITSPLPANMTAENKPANHSLSHALPSPIINTDMDFLNDNAHAVYNSIKDQEAFRNDPMLLHKINQVIQQDIDRSDSSQNTSDNSTSTLKSSGTQTVPAVMSAGTQTERYEPLRKELDEMIVRYSTLQHQFEALASDHNHKLQTHAALMGEKQQQLHQVITHSQTMEKNHSNSLKEVGKEREKLQLELQRVKQDLVNARAENQTLLSQSKSNGVELDSLKSELLQMTLKHESVRFESEGIQEELDIMKKNKDIESNRALAAEIQLVKLKLEVGIQILDNSLKHCEHQVAVISSQYKRVCESIEPEEVKNQYKEALDQWKDMVNKISRMKSEANDKFETQLKSLQEGCPLNALPVLDIPTPPPPPVTNLPPMRGSMPGQHVLANQSMASTRPAVPPGFSAAVRSSSSSALDKPTDLLAFSNAAKKAGGRPATWSNSKTAAEIIGSASTAEPKPKLPIGLNLTPKATRQLAKTQSKNSYAKIVDAVTRVYPNREKSDIDNAIRSFRQQRGGSLSGLGLHEIVERVLEIVARQTNSAAGVGSAWGGAPVVPPSNGQSRLEETDEVYEDECTICYDSLMSQGVTRLGCMHAFHSECLRKWLSVQSTCPHCRKLALMPDEFPSLK